MTIDDCRIKAKEMVDGIIFNRANWRILAELEDDYDLDYRTVTGLWCDLGKPDLRVKARYDKFCEALAIAREVKNAND